MNRRTFLQASGGTLSLVALAGCLDTIRDFQLGTPVTIHIENETDENQNVRLTAEDLDNGHQTYDESVSSSPVQNDALSPLSNSEQIFTAQLVDSDGNELDTAETFIVEHTQSITVIITDDGLELDVSERE